MAPRLRGSVMPSRATTSGMPGASGSTRSERVRVLVRRHLQGEPLVDGTVGEPVELSARRLEDGDPALGGDLQGLADAVVGVDASGDVHGRDRDVGAQRLDDRVAAGDDLAGGLRAAPRRRRGRSGERCHRAWPLPWPPCGPCGAASRWPWAWGPCPRGRGGAGRRSRLWRPSWSCPCGSLLGAGSCLPWCAFSGSSVRRASDQFAPEAVSSIWIPTAVSCSRMASAVAKSRAARAACACLELGADEGVEGDLRLVGPRCPSWRPSAGRAG